MNSYEHFADSDKNEVETYSRYIWWFLAGGISYWLTIGIMTEKTILPVFFVVLAF